MIKSGKCGDVSPMCRTICGVNEYFRSYYKYHEDRNEKIDVYVKRNREIKGEDERKREN